MVDPLPQLERDLDGTPTRVAYALWEYPAPSERFIAREIGGLEERGVRVGVFVLGRARRSAGQAAAAVDGTLFVRRVPASRVSCLGQAVLASLRHPLVALRAVTRAVHWGRREGLRGILRGLRMAARLLLLYDDLRAMRPDLVHGHFATLPATFARLAAASLGVPFGFSVHAKDLYASRVDFAGKVADATHVLACSHVAAADLKRHLPSAHHARVHAAYHGLDLEAWRRDGAPPIEVGGPPRLLAVGRFEPKKGFDVLLHACAQLRDQSFDFRCDIVGSGLLEGELANAIRAQQLADHVHLVPWLSQEDLRRKYLAAHVLVVPSRVAEDGDRDNIPNVLLEALALEVPVVASDLPGIREVLGHEHAGISVPPNAPRALADAIRRVTSDSALARRVALAGRALVEEHFDRRRACAHIHSVFASVAREQRSEPWRPSLPTAPTQATVPTEGPLLPVASPQQDGGT